MGGMTKAVDTDTIRKKISKGLPYLTIKYTSKTSYDSGIFFRKLGERGLGGADVQVSRRGAALE